MSSVNGLIRLMNAGEGQENWIDKYVRYKNNKDQMMREVDAYHLTEKQKKALEKYIGETYWIGISQEQMMKVLMDADLTGFTLKESNAARKTVSKKRMKEIPKFKEKVFASADHNLAQFIWNYGVAPGLGYSFSDIHSISYTFIGFQSAYLATHWNPIYWDTACLIVNSGSLEEEEQEIVDIYEEEDYENYSYKDSQDKNSKVKKKNTDFAKIAKAIGAIKSNGIDISLVNINTSDYGYKPDVENNRILYGLKSLSNISAEIIEKIKEGRPYHGIKDFMVRCPLGKLPMINLIKAGAFDEVEKTFKSRVEIMVYYISQVYEGKKKLTLANFNGLVQSDLVPKELELQIRIYNFTKYLKANKKVGKYFTFDDTCLQFYEKFLSEYLEEIEVINGISCILQTKWDKIYDKQMNAVRTWLKANHDEMLAAYNRKLFMESWNKYASGNTSHWEMESLCFYHGKHELADVNNARYGIADFNTLNEKSDVDYYFKRKGLEIPIFKLTKIAGTVLAKDDNRCTVTILTTTGVVPVKFSRDYYGMFKKQISQIQADGTKKVMEKGWFGRGNILMITGYRREGEFVGKTYKNTEGHQLYKIDEVVGDAIKIRHERWSADGAIEEDIDD